MVAIKTVMSTIKSDFGNMNMGQLRRANWIHCPKDRYITVAEGGECG